jgi:magnesium-transporting ATPase (P-type)
MSTVRDLARAGLSEDEAARRLEARGKLRRERSSRSYASIVRANTLTIPNGILLLFGVLTITFGSWKDALFLGILISNVAIGSFQEIRSKRALDKLASLVAPQAVVVRDGVDRPVSVDGVVVGDLVRLAAGDQVVADGTVVSADGLTLDEANLTGESEPVIRGSGEPVWSGSFATEGVALFEATAVGPQSRAARLTATAREFRHPRSPLEQANDRLLLWLVGLAVPLTVALALTAFTRVGSAGARVQFLTAGIVNLVPEGLILLIALTAAVSAFKVAQRGVLAQQLNAVESLASVDVVCTDKTGTLTEPTLRVVAMVPADGVDEDTLAHALASYADAAPTRNLTLQAIADARLADVGERGVVGQVPFSSQRRWSALDLGDVRLVLGAPERFAAVAAALVERASKEATAGRRILAIGRTSGRLPSADSEPRFPEKVQALGLSFWLNGSGRTPPIRSPTLPPRTSTSRFSRATRRPPWARSPVTPVYPDLRRHSTVRRCRRNRRLYAKPSCLRPPSAASRRRASVRSSMRSLRRVATLRCSETGSTTCPR